MSALDPRPWLEARREEMVALLEELISIPSVTGDEGAIAQRSVEWLAGRGLQAWAAPADERWNAVGAVGEGERSLVISGHLDTVPPADGDWTHDPWTPVREGDRVYGLGASDMHASQVAAYFAQAWLAEEAPALDGRVWSAFTIEEETTGRGTRLLLDWWEREGLLDFGQCAAVVTEPTGLESLCLGNRGAAFVEVELEGLSGHGSRPGSAHNPIDAVGALLDGARALESALAARHSHDFLGPPSVTPTSVLAGSRAGHNVIPGRARVQFDCRLTPDLWADSMAVLREGFEALCGAFGEPLRARYELRFPRSGQLLDPAHPLLDCMRGVLREELRMAVPEVANPAGNDAFLFGERSIPTINKLGPGLPACAHRIDEYAEVERMLRAAEIYARLAVRWLGLRTTP